MGDRCRRWSKDAERIDLLWDGVRGEHRKSWDRMPSEVVFDRLMVQAIIDPFWIPGRMVDHIAGLVAKGNLSGSLSGLALVSALARETLCRVRHGKGRPTFGTLLRTLNALGLRLPFLIPCGDDVAGERDDAIAAASDEIGRSNPKQWCPEDNQKPPRTLNPSPEGGEVTSVKGGVTSVKGGVTSMKGGVIAPERRGVIPPMGEVTAPQSHSRTPAAGPPEAADDVARQVGRGAGPKDGDLSSRPTPQSPEEGPVAAAAPGCSSDTEVQEGSDEVATDDKITPAQRRRIDTMKDALIPVIEEVSREFSALGYVRGTREIKNQDRGLTRGENRYSPGAPRNGTRGTKVDGEDALRYGDYSDDELSITRACPVKLNGRRGFFTLRPPGREVQRVEQSGASAQEMVQAFDESIRELASFQMQVRAMDREEDRKWRAEERARSDDQAKAFVMLVDTVAQTQKGMLTLIAAKNDEPSSAVGEILSQAKRYLRHLGNEIIQDLAQGESDDV